MRKSAFTLIELIFVIVIIGILSKYGIELLSQAYKSFIFSNVNNALQSQSAAAVESVASRLQYRIKDSVIARQTDGSFQALASNTDLTAPILEWVGYDADGFRGNAGTTPLWSGIVDLRHPNTNANVLVSPETNTVTLSALIGALSPGATTINDAALYFVGSDSDIQTGYGWDGNLTAINTQNGVIHPIVLIGGQPTQFAPAVGSFTGVDVYEYYQLAWTAYAVGITDYNIGANAGTNTGTLTLWYDYQPWKGENYSQHGTAVKLMDNVSTFRFRAAGSIVKIQVCVNSDLMEDYSLCKEKTVF